MTLLCLSFLVCEMGLITVLCGLNDVISVEQSDQGPCRVSMFLVYFQKHGNGAPPLLFHSYENWYICTCRDSSLCVGNAGRGSGPD